MEKNSLNSSDKGSAIVIVLLILALLMAFVALAISRTTSETLATSNDAAESRAFAAAEASLEVVTRNFNKIFEEKLAPDSGDLQHVQDLTPPGFDTDYNFSQVLQQTQSTNVVVMSGQLLQGLNALRDTWQIDTTATDKTSGVQVQLRRQFFNNRVPVFQFGIFYDDDLEFHPGPRFDFGGRVHSNSNLFLMGQTGLYFASRVSAAGQVFTDVAKNGRAWTGWGENVFIKNGAGSFVQLKHDMGTVLKTPVNGSPFFDSTYPSVYKSTTWASNKGLFQGNLISDQPRLDLPLVIASRINGNSLDYVELVKRGKIPGDLANNGGSVTAVTAATADSDVTTHERYANKPGIRITLADSKAKLPGCASGTGATPVSGVCGKRLDGDQSGDSTGTVNSPRGYKPLPMLDGYQATRVNGERLGTSGSATGRQVWIKIETMHINPVTELVETKDITADILSFGVTEPAPFVSGKFEIRNPSNYYSNYVDGKSTDERSIVKIQRFAMPGVDISATSSNWMTAETWNSGGTYYNIVESDECNSTFGSCNTDIDNNFNDDDAHKRNAIIFSGGTTKYRRVVPFPIEMFDTREGLYNDDINATDPSVYGNNVPWAGVMSMIDIDVANLKDFLNAPGKYNAITPNGSSTVFSAANSRGLKNTDIWDANGWVLYVSDRRGDYDFDGDYDMEDIFGNNDGIKQPGEDVNNNGILDADYANEAPKYTANGLFSPSVPMNNMPTTLNSYAPTALAASIDHSYYRRGVRLINGTTLPGLYDSANAGNTKGFTLASENGVYVLGNYNATGINSIGTPTASTEYIPQNTPQHIPASIVADAITILSTAWSDTKSFRYPFTLASRPANETTVRFAMLAGDTRTTLEATPNQGGSDPRMSGGVHNFKRFLEDWTNDRLNYAGSLINLFNSRNNNGSFKCCSRVYGPPDRNWVFDATFLDPTRLPPGTPFFQDIQLTGFQRVN
jgi:Tfp pilus assembly protein PilX